jgi:hypothetical protein
LITKLVHTRALRTNDSANIFFVNVELG